MSLLEGVLVGQVLLLAGRETLTEVRRLLEDHHLGSPVRRFQVGNERTEEFKSVAQVDSSLPLHRVVLRPFLAAVLRVGTGSGAAGFAWRSAAVASAHTSVAAIGARLNRSRPLLSRLLLLLLEFRGRSVARRRDFTDLPRRFALDSPGRSGYSQLQLLTDQCRWMGRQRFPVLLLLLLHGHHLTIR